METTGSSQDQWARGDGYEPYVGRWSRLVAAEFLKWLEAPPHAAWLDVGCGTGALSQSILSGLGPISVMAVDRSARYAHFARQQTADGRARFAVADARRLPIAANLVDAAVSGLVLNFVPEPLEMLLEMRRATRDDGYVALYVWDYAGKMQLMRSFWDAAAALDPAARELDEGRRFLLCNPDALRDLFKAAAFSDVQSRPIDVDTHFRDFDDYWRPFLGGQGPAPNYAMSLDTKARARLREKIRGALPTSVDGSIRLVARAWAIKGIK